MAVYDGFFDAVYNEETGEYDRDYSNAPFESYFANAIGSGVSICDNPDSCKVSFAQGKASIAIGFLFIQGYWARIKDEPYVINMDAAQTEPVAIIAHLNNADRIIELVSSPVAESYPDALCLATVNPATGEVEDTRYNTDICGVIGTSSDLYEKVLYAQNYIDNRIDAKLNAVLAEVASQEAAINTQIAAVNARVDSIAPPAVGSIKFSASSEIGDDWLRCDGSFVSEADYPELVAALGKLTPSNDKFNLISNGEIGPQISNGVLYGGGFGFTPTPPKSFMAWMWRGRLQLRKYRLQARASFSTVLLRRRRLIRLRCLLCHISGRAGQSCFCVRLFRMGKMQLYKTNIIGALIFKFSRQNFPEQRHLFH